MTIRAIIIDDEPLARQYLKELLAEHAHVEVIAECKNGFEAVKAVSDLEVDLLFLDIQMPKLDGFEVLELLDEPVPTIFVTAYDEYAVRAFDTHAVDYLLKPFTPERLAEAVSRVQHRPPPPDIRSEARAEDAHLTRIVIKDGSDIVIIPTSEIDCIQAEDDYVSVRTKGKSFLKHQTMASLEQGLDPAEFLRIHRSAIVRLDRIKRIELNTKDTYIAILGDGTVLPISRSGHKRLKGVLA